MDFFAHVRKRFSGIRAWSTAETFRLSWGHALFGSADVEGEHNRMHSSGDNTDMRYLFVVFAKLIGIMWSAFALAQALGIGLLLLGQITNATYFGYELAYRLFSFFALLLQLCLAVSLMLGTELWAVLVGVPRDPGDIQIRDPDLLAIGIKLIGIYSLLQAVPALATESLVLLHPDALPVTGVVDIVSLIQPGLTVLLGGICVFNTRSVVRLVTATFATESPEPDGDRATE